MVFSRVSFVIKLVTDVFNVALLGYISRFVIMLTRILFLVINYFLSDTFCAFNSYLKLGLNVAYFILSVPKVYGIKRLKCIGIRIVHLRYFVHSDAVDMTLIIWWRWCRFHSSYYIWCFVYYNIIIILTLDVSWIWLENRWKSSVPQ